MDNYNYVELIKYYSTKLVSENRISIHDKFVSNKIMHSIQFLQPEWFLDLDDDLRYTIEHNLFTPNIVSILMKTKKYKKNKKTLRK